MQKAKIVEKRFNTLFIKLMCFAVLITILSVFFAGLFPYIYLQNEMTADIKQFNNQKLQRLKDSFESSLFDLTFSFLNDFVLSSEARGILNTLEDAGGGINAYSVIQLRDLLNSKLAAFNKPFHDVLLYHEKGRKIISAKMGIRDLNEKSSKIRYDDGWIAELGDLSAYRTIKWLSSREIPHYSGYKLSDTINCISVILRLNPTLQAGSPVYICIRISEAEVEKLIGQVNPDDKIRMLLVTEDGAQVLGTGQSGDYSKLMDSIEPETFDREAVYSEVSNDTVYSITGSDSNNWYYLMITPKNHYYKTTDFLNKIVLVVCIAIFFITFIISLFFVFRLTSPFGELLKILPELGTPAGDRTKKTEMRMVVDAFSGLVQTRNSQQKLLSENRELVRQSLIAQLLTGVKMSEDELDSSMRFSSISLDYPYFTVVLLQYISLFNERSTLILSTLEQYMKEKGCPTAEFICYKCNEELYAVIVNHEGKDISELKGFFLNMMNMLENTCMITGSAAIGSTQEHTGDIPKSYRNAADALCYAAYYPGIKVLCYQDTELWDRNTQIDEALVAKLIKSIQSEQIDNLSFYSKMLCDSIHSGFISYKTTMKAIERIINAAEAQAASADTGSKLQQAALAERIENCYFITDIFSCIKDYIVDTFKSANKSMLSDISKEYTDAAISHMNAHFDKDITVQDIADVVGVSRYHLSRIFKENTGITLMEYLNELRFNKAEALLKDTSMSINEVAKTIGFNNISYFNRKFKQKFGTTPSQFFGRTGN